MDVQVSADATWEAAAATARELFDDYCAGRASLEEWEAADRLASELFAAGSV